MKRGLAIFLFVVLSVYWGFSSIAHAKVVTWKAPELTVKLELPKGLGFKVIYSRKAVVTHSSKPKFEIVCRVLPSMVVTPEEIRREGGHHHHEPAGAKELAKRLVGTAKAMNGRSASGRKVDVISTDLGHRGEDVWFGEEIYTISSKETGEVNLVCQRIYYSPKFTLSFFLEKKLEKGEDAKEIYRIFQKVAESVRF